MKKTIAMAAMLIMSIAGAQEIKQVPQVNVSGEGKVKVIPDQAFISISIESKGTKAADVKKLNDELTEKVIKAIRQSNLPKEDVQTRRVALNPVYDYEKKKYSYNATQTIEILLKDLSKYDVLMEAVVDAGVNRISEVEFRSSKIEQYRSEARKLAILEAKMKANDYVSVINQKIGKAITISDNTQVNYTRPMMYEMKAAFSDGAAPRETLAIGEIDVSASVNVSFVLE